MTREQRKAYRQARAEADEAKRQLDLAVWFAASGTTIDDDDDDLIAAAELAILQCQLAIAKAEMTMLSVGIHHLNSRAASLATSRPQPVQFPAPQPRGPVARSSR